MIPEIWDGDRFLKFSGLVWRLGLGLQDSFGL